MDSLSHGWVVSPSLGQDEVQRKCASCICGMSGGWMNRWMGRWKDGWKVERKDLDGWKEG